MPLEIEQVFASQFDQHKFVELLNQIFRVQETAGMLVTSGGTQLWVSDLWPEGPVAAPVRRPVTYQGALLGELLLLPSNGNPADHQKLDLLGEVFNSLMENQISHEYEVDNLSEEVLDRYEEINLLFELSEDLSAVFELHLIYEIILDKVVHALGVKKASLMSYDEANDRLVLEASRGLPEEVVKIVIPVENTVSGYVLQRGQPLLIGDLSELPKSVHLNQNGEYETYSFLSVPMLCSPVEVKNKKIGVINVTDKKNGAMFTTGDLKLLNTISSLAAITIYNARLIDELKGTERVQHELEIAETIQMSLLPSEPPHVPGVDIFGMCKSAKNVGGDYFDYFLTEHGMIDLIVADVSGHSIGSALMMAISRSVLRSVIHQYDSLSEILAQTNRLLFPDLDRAGLFISLFLAQYNPETHWLTYGNAGHPPLLVYKAKEKKVHELDAEGMIIGILEEVDFEEKSLHLDAGDIVLFYTDGIIEATNLYNEQFGEERLAEILKIFHDEPAERIVRHLYNQLDIFVQRREQNDDVTVIALKILE